MQTKIFIIAKMTLKSSLRGLHVLIALLSNCSMSFTFTTSKSLIAIDVSSPIFGICSSSPRLYRRARGGGVRGGGVVFDTEPGVLPITLQQLESQSMRGVGNEKKKRLQREGQKKGRQRRTSP